MNPLRICIFITLLTSTLLLGTPKAYPGIDTTLPVSAELGTGIAAELFPVGLDLETWNLFLSEPLLVFIDQQRIGLRARFQAYDHRPEEGVAISELGWLLISGKVGFDPVSRQVLLHEPSLNKLEFDRDTAATRKVHPLLMAAWSARVSDPIRADIPPHPYILPFKDNISDLSYDGKNINISISYQ